MTDTLTLLPQPRRRRRRRQQQLLEPAIRSKLMTYLKAGNTRAVSARLSGVPVKTLEEWIRRGKGEDADRPATRVYIAFAEEVLEAEAYAHMYAVSQVRQGMAKDPRAAMWWLENRDPDWRRRNEPPPPPAPTSIQVTAPTQVIVVEREMLEELGLKRVREMRQVGDGTGNGAGSNGTTPDDVRRSRLVEDSAAPVEG